MYHLLPRFLCLAFAIFVAGSVRGESSPASIVWTLDSLENVGGRTPEIWGAPKLVGADANGPGPLIRFDGKTDGLLLPVIPIAGWKEFTVEILFFVEAGGLPEQRFLHLQDEKGRRLLIELRLTPANEWYLDTFLYSDPGHRLALIDETKLHPAGRWHWAALSYADGRMTHFVDGVKEGEGVIPFEPMVEAGRTSLGVRQNKVSWFKGAIREVRFTPVVLPAEKLQRL